MTEEQPITLPALLTGLSQISKRSLEALARIYIEERLSTDSTLELAEQIKRIQTVADIMEPYVKERLRAEYASSPGSYGNLTIGFKGGRRSLDFSRDVVWNRLKKAIDDREEFLKGLKEPADILDKETGEVLTAWPPLTTYGKDSVSIALH